MRAAVALLVVLAGCIAEDVQHCGDRICPTSEVCIDDQRCVSHAALAACMPLQAGAACLVDGVNGRCTAHAAAKLVCDPAVCGDGVIDEPLHEQCDGAAPFPAECVDLGFDLGRPACTTACGLDSAPCTRFGWDLVVNAPVYRMWTDGTTLAYTRRNPDALEVHGGGHEISLPGFYTQIVGGGGRLVVAGEGLLAEVVGNDLVSLAPPFDATYVGPVAVADDGSVYADYMCTIWQRSGTWKSIATLTTAFCSSAISVSSAASGHRVFLAIADQIYELVGGVAQARFTIGNAFHQMMTRSIGGSEMLLVASSTGLDAYPVTGGSPYPVTSTELTSIAATTGLIYGSRGGVVSRWDGKQLDQLRAPGGSVADDGAGHVFAYGGPMYRFSGIDFGELAPPPLGQADEQMTATLETSDATIAASTYSMYEPGSKGDIWTDLGSPVSPNSIRALAGTTRDRMALSAYLTFPGGGKVVTLWILTPGTYEDTVPPGDPLVDGLWMAPDQTLFAAGDLPGMAFLGKYTTTWVDIATPLDCEMHGVWGLDASHVIAVGGCGGMASVWSYDGATWTELHRAPELAGPLHTVRVYATGEIFAAGDGGALWFVGGAWSSDPTVRGLSMSGTRDDLWLAGAFTPIQHWDGATWSEMTTHSLGHTVVIASPERVLLPGGAPGHVVVVRDQR